MVQPEYIRRAWANKHAELQIFKLKVLIGLAVLVWLVRV